MWIYTISNRHWPKKALYPSKTCDFRSLNRKEERQKHDNTEWSHVDEVGENYQSNGSKKSDGMIKRVATSDDYN